MNDLFDKACAVRHHAYAPYSHFQVGVALRAANGNIYTGCNVENAAYPEGLCAEAGAIAAMVADGQTHITEICIVSGTDTHASPCGGCRQKLAEFASDDLPIHLGTKTDLMKTTTLGALLPGSFRPDHLKTR